LRGLTLVLLGLFLALLLYAEGDLPGRGDPAAPASTHVSPYYIQHSLAETKTPNLVTSVLADYRGYDTLGETVVIVTAALAAALVLLGERRAD
jgi:multicomponent Na+:H+ antiporter subunit B